MGAVERIDAILAVPGIDAVMIGPADLAMDMGLKPRADHSDSDHKALCQQVLEACQKHGVVPGIFCSGPEEGARRAEEGWRFLPVGSDIQYTLQGAIGALRQVRKARQPESDRESSGS